MQVFRSSPGRNIGQGVLVPILFLGMGAGLAANPGGPSDPGTAPGYIAVGVLIAAIGVILSAGQLRCRIIVTDRDLTSQYFRRTRSVAWHDVQDIEVTQGRSGYYPAARTSAGLVLLQGASGSERWAKHVAAAIQELRPASLPEPVWSADGIPSAAEA